MDELDRLMRIDPDTPLFDELMAALDEAPLPVDPVAADAAAGRLARRLGGEARERHSQRPAPWALGLGLAALCAAVAALALLPPIGPPAGSGEPVAAETVAPAPELAPLAAEAAPLPEAPPDVAARVRDLIAAEDWMVAWRAAAGVRLAEEDLRALALGLHRAALGDYDPATLEAAASTYEAYLAAYSAGPRDDKMRYAYAELLYRSERYPEAYEQYLSVVDRHPDSQHAEFCAASAVFAAEQLVEPEREGAELSEWEERTLDAIDAYVAHWPDNDKSATMSYKAGYLLVSRGRTEGALPHLLAVMRAAPESAEARLGAELLADAWGEDAAEQALAAAGSLPAEDAELLLERIARALDAAGRADEAAAVRGAR